MQQKLHHCCLGIESTAHTFGAAIIKDKQVLSNVRDAYTTTAGGMIPFDLSCHHLKVCYDVVKQALDKAEVSLDDVDVISFSQSPGIGHALRVGASCARLLASKHEIPLVGVNHCIAHLEIGHLLSDAKDPVLCYVSGANTQIIALQGGRYRVFGETLDVGVGNLLDSVARHMGLGFPGGPKIAALADTHTSHELLELPYTVKGMDISFGGLETTCKKLIDSGVDHAALAYALQETVFAMIAEVTERALAHCDKSEVLLGGGVACNVRLQRMIQTMCDARGATCYVLPNEYNIDNAAMIAWNGLQLYAAGSLVNPLDVKTDPYLRTDDVDVIWGTS